MHEFDSFGNDLVFSRGFKMHVGVFMLVVNHVRFRFFLFLYVAFSHFMRRVLMNG